MKKIFLLLLLTSTMTFFNPSFGQIYISLVDLENNQTINFPELYETYNLDKEKLTVLITWSAKWCMPCIDLIDRYNLCDPEMINLITVNVEADSLQADVLAAGYHLKWNNALNFHANLGNGNNGFDYVFNVERAPLVLFIKDGMIINAIASYNIFPLMLIQSNIISDIRLIWDSPEDLNSLAWYYYLNKEDMADLEEAKEWVIRSMELDKNYHSTDTYAALLYKTGQNTKALKVAKEAIEIAKEDGANYESTTELINKIIEAL